MKFSKLIAFSLLSFLMSTQAVAGYLVLDCEVVRTSGGSHSVNLLGLFDPAGFTTFRVPARGSTYVRLTVVENARARNVFDRIIFQNDLAAVGRTCMAIRQDLISQGYSPISQQSEQVTAD